MTQSSIGPGKFSTCCVKGNLHEGETTGSTKELYGVQTYVAGESNGPERAIVIFSDVFGLGLKNNLLIADRLADAGYTVYLPDLFEGDCLAPEVLSETSFDADAFNKWVAAHTPEVVTKIALGFITQLRSSYPEAFIGTIGHCYGARFAMQFLGESGIATAGAVAHPSYVTEEEFALVRNPLLISAAETDPAYLVEARHKSEAILSENKVRYQIDLFSGVTHGFSVRGDVTNPVVKYAKEKVLADQLTWFAQF